MLGQETTHPFHGGHRRHDDVYIGAIGDLRSNCVLGRVTTHPFHGGHRRHNQDLGTGGTTRGERIAALLVRSTEDLTLHYRPRRVRSVFERTKFKFWFMIRCDQQKIAPLVQAFLTGHTEQCPPPRFAMPPPRRGTMKSGGGIIDSNRFLSAPPQAPG